VNSADIDCALAASLESVLQEMFFVSVMGEPAPDGESDAQPLSARLDFEGRPEGSLLLKVTPAAARSIAADFLAEDEEALTPQQVEDVIRELTNMICGAALSRLESDTSFRLGAPHLTDDSAPEDFTNPATRSVDIGAGTITVLLQFKTDPCLPTAKLVS